MSLLAETRQRNQPEGVPPLSLTGERTLPDVPAENYWYRRHLVVYKWIAERCRGLDVVDLACAERCDAIVFLQTIEHVRNPGEILDRLRSLLRPGGTAYVSTPNVLTLAPDGQKSGNPWHVKEYRADEFRALCEASFEHVDLLGLFHARKLRMHELAIARGWDRLHSGLGITDRFYEWFTPAIGERDFALRPAPLDRALDFLGVLR